MYLFYSFLLTTGLLLGLPFFLVQALLHRKYISSLGQRLGFLPAEVRHSTAGGIWVHAVSVGELLAVLPLLKRIKQAWPGRPLFVSTTTLTGQTLARQKMGGQAAIFYFPLDWTFSVRKALNQVRPSLVLIAETEIWPNFLRCCHGRKIPLLLVNGRISDKSLRRYGRVRWLVKRILKYFSACCMQTAADAERILQLGADTGTVEVCGNLKYDLTAPADIEQKTSQARRLFNLETDPIPFVFIAGSTMPAEEEMVIEAFSRLAQTVPQSLLILAPRHPERFQAVADLLQSSPIPAVRRSWLGAGQAQMPGQLPAAILLDSMGELAALYALADAVFVGGSLVPAGGHNILEPALYQKPVIFGPYMNNFREMAALFVGQQAGFQVQDAKALGAKLIEFSRDARARKLAGERSARILEANRGATERILLRAEHFLR